MPDARVGNVQIKGRKGQRDVAFDEPMDAYSTLLVELKCASEVGRPNSRGRYAGAKMTNGIKQVPVAKP